MSFETVTDEMWQQDLDLKLFAAIRFSRLVWPGMKERKWGRIINVLNTAAKAPPPASTPTSVSRAAGMALTKVMAGEGGPHNILVNAMLVGLIVSDQWVQRHAKTAPGTDFNEFTNNAKAFRSAAWVRRKNSPTSPASWPPSRDPTSRAPPSMSMAGVPRWCSPRGSRRYSDQMLTFAGRLSFRARSFRSPGWRLVSSRANSSESTGE
jgi:NAD(P)-dependent dehydrogenase (short-subunit alcohol dehydrogenase family)